MNPLKFALTISMYPTLDMVKAGLLAEKYGFDHVLVPDHLTDLPPSGDKVDPWTVLTAIGVQTNHILLNTGVTDTQRIHPVKTAHIVATLDELTNGRGALAIGAGEAMNLEPYGISFGNPEERAEKLREAVQVIKLIWESSRSNPVNFEGRYFKLRNAWMDQKPVQKPAPSIYIGALGTRRTLKIVGELADGWFPWFNTLNTFNRRLRIIKEAAEKAGRSLNQIDKIHLFFTAVTDDKELQRKAVDAIKTEILVINHPNVLRELGFDPQNPEGLDYAYQRVIAEEGIAKHASKIAEQMPDEVAKHFMLVGGPDDCIEAIDKFRKAGANQIALRDVIGQYVYGSLEVAEKTIKVFGEKIIPYFKSLQ